MCIAVRSGLAARARRASHRHEVVMHRHHTGVTALYDSLPSARQKGEV